MIFFLDVDDTTVAFRAFVLLCIIVSLLKAVVAETVASVVPVVVMMMKRRKGRNFCLGGIKYILIRQRVEEVCLRPLELRVP